MCRFLNLNISIEELEGWFDDFDRKISKYENEVYIVVNSHPILPILIREGILKKLYFITH